MGTKRSGTDETDPTRGGGWRFPLLLAVLFLALVSFARCTPQLTSIPPAGATASRVLSPQPTGQTVRLEIDFGNGAKKIFAAIPWQEQMTIADLMKSARQFQPGIVYSQVGEGEMGFLSSVEGVANEGADGRNWIYQVDDRHAHRSFCLEKVEPSSHVLWTFTDERYNEQPK